MWTSNKNAKGAAIFVGEPTSSATPLALKLNYIKNVQPENIITSEPAKLLGMFFWSNSLC
jgi:hypothetical protein